MIADMQAVLLAGGRAKRFNSGKSKFIETVCGKELIHYPVSLLQSLQIPITMVVGSTGNHIKNCLEQYQNIQYVKQAIPQGTANAVRQSKVAWSCKYLLIMKADIPLLTAATIEKMYKKHIETQAAITFLYAHNSDTSGTQYDKVIKNDTCYTIKPYAELVNDTTEDHCCINTEVYLITRSFIEQYLDQIKRKEITGEYHISDLIDIAYQTKHRVNALSVPFDQIRGVSTLQEIWAVEQIKRAELIKQWMEKGVRFCTAQTVHLDADIHIGTGSSIGGGVHITRGTTIGNNCMIGPFALINNTKIGDNVRIESHSVLHHASVGNNCVIGPFAHVQEKSILEEGCHIGNFVEIKRSTMGKHTKAKHLAYIGDALIGSHVNIGAGAITCNYDGKTKHTTTIHNYAFIGTNNSLVAPVTIGERAFTAAGSVITDHVPAEALAIARAKQVNKEGYTTQTHKEPADNKQEPEHNSVLFQSAIKSSTTIR